MRVRLKSGEVYLFDGENPLLVQIILENYPVYYKYDECRDLFFKIFEKCNVKYINYSLSFHDSAGRMIANYNYIESHFWVNEDVMWFFYKKIPNLGFPHLSLLIQYFIHIYFEMKYCGISFRIPKGVK